jgi:hypothetical protein
MKPSLHPAVEHDADGYARFHSLKWSFANAATNYVPLSNTMKQMACSIPKLPGTQDVNHHPEGSSYVYEDSGPLATNRYCLQGDNASSYLTLETTDSSQDYRNRLQVGQGQNRTQQTRYFMLPAD